MILGEAAIVLMVLIVAGGLVIRSAVKVQAKSKGHGPELAHAMRLLDRVIASDDALPQLPQPLRVDIERTVHTYYKEIEK